MTSLTSFDDGREFTSSLDGNSQKTRMEWHGAVYIVKYGNPLEPDPSRPLQGSYNHSPLSEFLGSRIFSELGIPAQEVVLGTLHEREVVACKDFTIGAPADVGLVQFRSLENAMISSSARGQSPRLEDIEKVIEEHPFLRDIRQEARDRYWDTFVVDAIIGNFDRHSGNWGYLAERDPRTNGFLPAISPAPVFDCGSSLAPRLSEDAMERLAGDQRELARRARSFPRAKLIVGGGKGNVMYHEFLLSQEGADARAALWRLLPRIDALDIGSLVNSVPGISQVRARFLEQMIRSRISAIIDPARALAAAENLNPDDRPLNAGHGPHR